MATEAIAYRELGSAKDCPAKCDHSFETTGTGGGLTLIANAPNPAGAAILKEKFADGAIHPLGLLMAAIPPTLVAVIAFRLL